MRAFLTKGLAETHALWADVEMGYRWVYRAAHLLVNEEKQSASQIRQNYEALLAEIEQAPQTSETPATMLTTFCKVTASYWPGLFHCYDMADLPRTNNDLEQYFGSARYHERRATGRKTASPAVVVRGAVRIVASVATQRSHFCGADLQPTEIEQWYILREALDARQQARRAQFRFRRDPGAYLGDLENKLLQLRLPP